MVASKQRCQGLVVRVHGFRLDESLVVHFLCFIYVRTVEIRGHGPLKAIIRPGRVARRSLENKKPLSSTLAPERKKLRILKEDIV